MKKNIVLGLLLFYSFSLINAQKKEEKELIIKQIQQNDRKFETFILKNMTDSVASMFSPNCHLANEFGTLIENEKNVKDYFVGEKKTGKKYISYSLKPSEQKVYDDIVLEVGTNTVQYSIGMDKRLYTSVYNYMLVWKKSKNGGYQIRAAMWNLTKNPCSQ